MSAAWHYLGKEGARARPAVRFADDVPEPRQLALLDAMRAIGGRVQRERVRKLEANGASVLAAKPESPAKRAHVVRLYFVSMADELLAAEFGGLTDSEASAIVVGRDAQSWSVKRPRDVRCTGLVESDPLAAHYPRNVGTSGFVERPIPALRPGARLVVFPSEIPNGVEQL